MTVGSSKKKKSLNRAQRRTTDRAGLGLSRRREKKVVSLLERTGDINNARRSAAVASGRWCLAAAARKAGKSIANAFWRLHAWPRGKKECWTFLEWKKSCRQRMKSLSGIFRLVWMWRDRRNSAIPPAPIVRVQLLTCRTRSDFVVAVVAHLLLTGAPNCI